MGTFANLTPEDFTEAIYSLLPTGIAWSRDPSSYMSAFINGVADGVSIVHAHASLLSEVESDPRLTSAMLSDWEVCYGLPDPCVALALEQSGAIQTTQERRNALVQRITTRGGQSIPYFIGVAFSLGYIISITEFVPFKVGHNRMGDSIPTDSVAFLWQVTAHDNINLIEFKVGLSTCVDPLVTFAQTPLQCLMNELKPAHTTVQFAFV